MCIFWELPAHFISSSFIDWAVLFPDSSLKFLYILIIHLLSDMQWVKIFFQSVLIPTWLPISMYCRSLLVSYSLIYQLLMFAELLESSSESICLHLHCTNFHIFPVAVQSLMSYPKIFHTFRTVLYRLKYGMISSFSRII